MLNRVVDSLYWISRYVERAENLSRFVEVSKAMGLDCPPGSAEPWLPLVNASGDREAFDKLYPQGRPDDVVRFIVDDRRNGNSIVSCIAAARENARQIRDVITTEMWEHINDLHWSLEENATSAPIPSWGASGKSAAAASCSTESTMPRLAAISRGVSVNWVD